MTDDLVKFLRTSTSAAFNKAAADRIEALEQEVERRIEPEQVEKLIEMAEPILAEVYAAECAYRKEAEARLAKAVEALREMKKQWHIRDLINDDFMDMLAEIEGGKDE
jgi:hypothetical protein